MRRRLVLGLIAAGLAFPGRAGQGPSSGWIGTFAWNDRPKAVGGISGLRIMDDGQGFLAVIDRGFLLRGQFQRDAQGVITGVKSGPPTQIKGLDRKAGRKARTDSEAIDIAPDGSLYISFEHDARVQWHRSALAVGGELPIPPEFARFEANAALEAMAVDAQGVVYTLPEEPQDQAGFPVWRYDGTVWDQRFHLPARGGFLAVDADFGPDGRFYLLERSFGFLSGFSSRVRSFRLTENGPKEERIEMQSPAGLHDNLEGLAVWQDRQGLRMTLVSDDNFLAVQQTEFVEYRISAPP